jgi:hypothetical protein
VAVTEVAVEEVTVAASAVLNLTAVGAVTKVAAPPPAGVIVTLVPTAPVLGVPFVGTSGQLPSAAPVVNVKAAEGPVLFVRKTVVDALLLSEPGMSTWSWVSASMSPAAIASVTGGLGACWNVAWVTGPPFAAS